MSTQYKTQEYLDMILNEELPTYRKGTTYIRPVTKGYDAIIKKINSTEFKFTLKAKYHWEYEYGWDYMWLTVFQATITSDTNLNELRENVIRTIKDEKFRQMVLNLKLI